MSNLPVPSSSGLPEAADEIVDAEIIEDVEAATAPKDKKLAELAARRARMMREGHINNSALYAGSPMYYYCKFCGAETDVKSETWITPPRRICGDCQTLIDLGWHDGETPVFPYRNQGGVPDLLGD